MSSKIGLIVGEPQFSALPAIKITHYPLEKGSYKPYVQVKLCINETDLFMRAIVFEAKPIEESIVTGAFCFGKNEHELLVLQSSRDNSTAYSLMADTEHPLPHKVHFFAGEDLQGVFWGVDISIAKDDLAEHFPNAALEKGGVIKANFYKTCLTPPFVHMGSFYPCDFTEQHFISPHSMAEFEIVDY